MKYLDAIWPLRRLPKRIELGNGEVQIAKNVGVAPDGTLRAMRDTNEQTGVWRAEDSDVNHSGGRNR